jgi:energy-coupling factor transporter ATP-binding protein EcfA2
MLPSVQVMRISPGYFLRQYFLKHLPFLHANSPLGMVLLGLFLALVGTGYAAWKAIQKWGETSRVVATESRLGQSTLLSALWYAPTGELFGYRQEGWKVTLLRWPTDKGLRPAQVQLDLAELTPIGNQADNISPASPSLDRGGFPRLNAQVTRNQKQASQFSSKGTPSSNGRTDPTAGVDRSTAAPLVAVSEDLLGVAWVWRGNLYRTLLGGQSPEVSRPAAWNFQDRSGRASLKSASTEIGVLPAVEKAQSARPSVVSYRLPADVVHSVALQFAGATAVILQDESTGRISFLDLREGKTITSFSASAPCPVAVVGTRALVVCVASPQVMILDFSKLPKIEKTEFRVPDQQARELNLVALALSRDGTPAIGTDLGTVLIWPADESGQRQLKELRSPGIAEAIDCDERAVLVGGGFRGIYALQEGAEAKLLVNDITGTSLLAIERLERTEQGLKSGRLAFGTREGVSVASLSAVRRMNKWGYAIAAAWLGFWALYCVGIPGASILLEESRREREVRVRTELGRSVEAVGISSAAESGALISLGEPSEKLLSACVAGECVAFIGAGLGAQAGLPTWQPMIQSLLTDASRKDLLDPKETEALQEAMSEGQWNVVADELVDKLEGHGDMLQSFLAQTYLREDIRPTPVHHLLSSLNLSGVLSTSFDQLLETTFKDQIRKVYTHQDSGTLLELLTKRQFFFAKLYGSLDKPGSLLIGGAQFDQAMARNPLFSRFVETLFFSKTLFFIGAGFEGIESYLSGLKIAGASEQKHFALVAAHGGAWRAKADLLRRRYGIQVLPFSSQLGFAEVERFLGKLASAVAPRIASSAVQPERISRLKSVTLKNIGPFDDMTLELDSQWTVLLGDNGVGKSTILRAIAVGLAGSEAGEYAGRLISAGKESDGASIILRTDGGNEYTTVISKGDRTMVQSRGSRPLEVERWLALGFPPLRTFTLAPIGDFPAKGLQRLTAGDLMPLITGEVDPRPDKLKAWLVDLDYRDKDQRASNRSPWSFLRRGESPTQFTSLIEQFFQVIRELTPGLKLGEVQIDVRKKEVRVQTDDGLLRIEMVSQGTQSLLGWVGILLQRLNDFYSQGSDEVPSGSGSGPISLLDQHALVLMDEIDAHMHPKWQQLIVHSLKQLFPNVQFVVTTHSPLIVAGMDRREVRVARRADPNEPQAGRVILEPPKQKLKGLRADQILTAASLFNMESTLTPDIESARQRYTVLAAKNTLTREEQSDLDKLAENLEIRAPAPHESELARLAFDKMQQLLETQLGNLSSEQKQKLMEEAKVQIQENITGSRRP